MHRTSSLPVRTALAWLAGALGLLALTFASPASAQVQQPPPVVERLEPAVGSVGTTVQMIGRFFRPDQHVFLGQVELPVSSRLPSRWALTVPPGAVTGRIEIRLADGTRVAGPDFRVTASAPAPTVSGFTPVAGAAGGEVRILGENFSPRITDNAVTLNGVAVVVRQATPTELTVIVPTGATSGPFVVRVAGAGEATSTTQFTVGSGTQIVSFEPRVASPGARVTIRGTGYSPRATTNRVFLENVALRVLTATETELVVELPANVATGRLLVDVRGGGRVYAAENLTILPAPAITAIDPISGVIGATIRIRGANFGTDIRQVQAVVGTVPLTLRAVTPTELTVQIPAGATTGTVSVAVAGLPPVVSAQPLTVLVPVAVSGLEPISGPVGTEVTIRGQGFSTVLAENRVTLSNVDCPVLAATPTELRVRIPQSGSGSLVVTVLNAGQARTTQPFVITTPPFIARVEPAAATIGSVVRIVGTNFGTAAQTLEVALAGRRMELRSVSDTALEVVVPPGATSGRITVTSRLQGTGTSPVDFTVLTDFAFAALEPAAAHPSQWVTVRGGGFVQEGLTVQFTGSAAPAAFVFVNGNELRVLVPVDAQTGPLTVRLPDGRSLAQSFTRADAPAGLGVLEVVPACRRPGCSVLVRGWGFGTRPSGQTVTFGGQRLRVRRATGFELEMSLPRRPGTAPLRIEVRGQPAVETAPLTIDPNAP